MTIAQRTFVEIFAGCGGLSLGLKRAGWSGLFAVERDAFAFETLERNFLGPESRHPYQWPAWLPQRAWDIRALMKAHRGDLAALRGAVTLVAGGPPCQGFSSAGRRKADDPRNALMSAYIRFIELLAPRYLILENVRGFTLDFDSADGHKKNFSQILIRRLSKQYQLYANLLCAADFGVPQLRRRFIVVGIRRDAASTYEHGLSLRSARKATLDAHGLVAPVSSQAAISDLERTRVGTIPSPDSKGFLALSYHKPRTRYQRSMREHANGAPSDTRLARHSPEIEARFKLIIEMCHSAERNNRQLTTAMRASLGLKKVALRALDPSRPAPTITSMPDDLLHYREPRTLTVRENARLQSFPDWFQFRGKYTTGGHLRTKEVPRFTQVANAVPPLLAEALGRLLQDITPARTRRGDDRYILPPA